MSEAKRYELKDIGPTYHKRTEMVLSVYGCWVYYDDYAELKAQRDALAAENVVMKVSRQAVVNAFDDAMNEFGMAQGETSADYPSPQTPATDAYLNSVRAEGVEMCIASCDASVNSGEDWPPLGSMREIARALRAGETS